MGAVGKKACLIKTVDVHEIPERTTSSVEKATSSSAHSRGRGGDDAHVEPGPSNTSGLDKDGRERGKASIKKKRRSVYASDDDEEDGPEPAKKDKRSQEKHKRGRDSGASRLSVSDDEGREPPSSQKRRSVIASDDDEEDGPEPAKKDKPKKDKRSQEKHKRGRDGGASRLAVSDEEGSSAGQSETGSSQKSVQVQPPTPVFGPLGSGT